MVLPHLPKSEISSICFGQNQKLAYTIAKKLYKGCKGILLLATSPPQTRKRKASAFFEPFFSGAKRLGLEPGTLGTAGHAWGLQYPGGGVWVCVWVGGGVLVL